MTAQVLKEKMYDSMLISPVTGLVSNNVKVVYNPRQILPIYVVTVHYRKGESNLSLYKMSNLNNNYKTKVVYPNGSPSCGAPIYMHLLHAEALFHSQPSNNMFKVVSVRVIVNHDKQEKLICKPQEEEVVPEAKLIDSMLEGTFDESKLTVADLNDGLAFCYLDKSEPNSENSEVGESNSVVICKVVQENLQLDSKGIGVDYDGGFESVVKGVTNRRLAMQILPYYVVNYQLK